MKRRRLGRTKLEVSVIGFGGVPIQNASKEEACRMIRRAVELGINFFDTGRAYCDVEEKLGMALKGVRDEVVIATKTLYRNRENMARLEINQSLRKLKTDHIDIYSLHGIDNKRTLEQVMNTEGAVTALEEARTQGTIDFIGITGHNPYILAQAIRTGKFDVVLTPLNLIDRLATEELLPLARELDVGTVAMKPFGGVNHRSVSLEGWGLFHVTDKTEFERILGNDKSGTDKALKFVLSHPVSTVIPGFSSIKEVESAARIGREFAGLTPQEAEDLKIGDLPPSPFCRRCGLCMPCLEGLDIPLILTLQTYHTYYGIKNWTRQVYDKLPTKVDSCTKCAECEPKCPYKLPLIDMLLQAEKTLF